MKIYLKKLLFKSSHRGTKEMDIILGTFANKQLESMTKKALYVLHQKTSEAGDIGKKLKKRGFVFDFVIPPL